MSKSIEIYSKRNQGDSIREPVQIAFTLTPQVPKHHKPCMLQPIAYKMVEFRPSDEQSYLIEWHSEIGFSVCTLEEHSRLVLPENTIFQSVPPSHYVDLWDSPEGPRWTRTSADEADDRQRDRMVIASNRTAEKHLVTLGCITQSNKRSPRFNPLVCYVLFPNEFVWAPCSLQLQAYVIKTTRTNKQHRLLFKHIQKYQIFNKALECDELDTITQWKLTQDQSGKFCLEDTSHAIPDLERLSLSDDNAHLVDLPETPPATGGGFCELYIGSHRPTGIKLAMKRPKTLFPTDDMLRRFRREADIWATLEHINIAPFCGTLLINQRLYLASPWMALGDLLDFVQARSQCIKDGKLSEHSRDDSVPSAYSRFNEYKAVRETASGLEYLHSMSIVHGDMKAKNVLLDDRCCVKICDFGLTKHSASTTSTDFKGVGSVRWQSPELFFNEPKSPMSDVYAFALTIVETLSGNYPFPQLKEPTAIIMAVAFQNERPESKPTSQLGVDFNPLWKLAAQCWSKKPEERLTMAQVLQQLDLELEDGKLQHSIQNGHSPPAAGNSIDKSPVPLPALLTSS